MAIKVPQIKTYKTFSAENLKRTFAPRNFVKQMASDGFLPVIALEAFVEGGRTYQAYKRGGFDEARERITEEFSGAVFWLGGVTGLNWIFEKLGQKILKLPSKTSDIGSDDVRKPLENFLQNETRTIKGEAKKIPLSLISKFKFIKVISSVLLANALIGFALPKINQAITRSYHKNDKNKNNNTNPILIPDMNNFVNGNNNENNNPSFTGKWNLLNIANKFESDRNWKLISVDVGTTSGRAISARNPDESVEIAFRDISSIYFYMFNMYNMNKWLNKIENGKATRLDPVSAQYTSEYLNEYFNDIHSDKVSLDKFKDDVMGKKESHVWNELKTKFEGKKVVTLEEFNNELKKLVPEKEYAELSQIAEKMSKLQPQIKGTSIITMGQARDTLLGGHINNPEFLMEFFKNRFGNKFMDKYKYMAQSELDAVKKDLVEYVESIIEKARKTNAKEITRDMLEQASKHNFKMNAINWGTGFAISALFLSTVIPKTQYLITKWRTGEDAFPGTAQYREQEKKA